ncbi:MAG: nucleotidyltransferase family protein [Pseudomonadota bacterium]
MTTAPQKAMVFAAGLGTRMRPLTATRPKSLIVVAGQTLLDHALDRLAEAGIREAVVNTHYLPDQIAGHIARQQGAGRTPLTLNVTHEPRLLDTGGGLKAALPRLGTDPVLTLNTDAIWQGPPPLPPLLSAWAPERMDALLLLVRLGAAVAHPGAGDFDLDPAGRLIRRGARPSAAYVYTGAQILKTARVAAAPDAVFSLNPIWDEIIAEGRAFGLLYAGHWGDVGHPAALPLVEAMVTA